jgi:hydrophobic/amphiphilic exporter-1 (mainly G- bacteria), HAE1 family
MAFNISASAIRNPIPPIVLFLALVFAGLTAYFRLPINQLPNIEFPGFAVSIGEPGGAPREIETQITQRVEAALTNVQGVKEITSSVSQGSSQTIVELEFGADISRAVDDARDALSRIRSQLPADMSEPVIERLETAAEPIAYYAIEGKGMTESELSWFIDNDLNRELLAVPGVSQVQRIGGVDREVRVELDPQVLLSFGVTADEISRQLRSINVDLPGGRAEIGGQAQTIRTLGGADTIEALAGSRITLPDGRSIRLEELGTVVDSSTELSQIARFNGQPAISVMISRAKGTSEVHVFDAMAKKLKVIEKNGGVTFRLINTSVDFIKGMHESSLMSLLEGALLATLVVFLVLRDWRATLICAAAIPLSIIPTFAFMEPLGFTLNMITLIALSLVAGVLVDDAIVEIENIVRHMRDGKPPYQAAIEAADEIGLAVVATTATIIAVFLPVSFLQGTTTGQFFNQFGITVAIAVFISLLVARLITPMMAAHFLRPHEIKDEPGIWRKRYEKILEWAIHNPWKTVAGGFATFVFSLLLMSMVPTAYIPRIDNGVVQAVVEFPPGTPLLDADRKLRDITERTRGVKEIEGVFSSVRGAEGATSQASVTFQLVDRSKRKISSYEVQQRLRPILTSIPDVRISFQNFQGGSRGADITLSFVGQDRDLVAQGAEHLVTEMKKNVPELADVRSSASVKRPEIQIRPRADEAAKLGVSVSSIAAAARIASSGDVDQNLAKFNLSDRQVPIRVLLRPDARDDLETIRSLRVRTASGEPVRLDAVADVSFNVGEAQTSRRNRQREVTVYANVTKGETNTALAKVMKLPAVHPQTWTEKVDGKEVRGELPKGVDIVAGGETEEMGVFFKTFLFAMLWGVLLVYAVLVLLFRDFYQPITILTAFPLSLAGAFVGLMVTGQPFSMFVAIGLVMLMGIVTKNSILLVDFAVEAMHKGMSRNAALLEAGKKRARPIVMTTIAMSAGMIPVAAGFGPDGTLRQGMGVAVIGGLLMSTLLSLIFVPAVFVLIDRLERKITPFFSRFSSTHDDNRKPQEHPAE